MGSASEGSPGAVETRALEEELETLSVELSTQFYLQYAALPHDPERMRELSALIETLARRSLERYPAASLPRPLFLALAASARQSALTAVESEQYRLRGEAVRVEAPGGQVVHLDNCRLFWRQHLKDGALRRQVFDGLMERAGLLDEVLERRFEEYRKTAQLYGLNVLDVYLEEERVELRALERLVHESAVRAVAPFREMAPSIGSDVLGKPIEYFDDFYVMGGAIYEPFDRVFSGIDFEAVADQVLRGMGFDLARIQRDGEPRDGKYASPVCFGIRVPGDVRVLYQRHSPFNDFTSYFHEMGHAVHFASVDPGLPYHRRATMPSGVDEIFSTLFESVATDPVFLGDELRMEPGVVQEVARRERFMELYYLRFYAANSMLQVELWKQGLDVAAATELYGRLAHTYLEEIPLPGSYWKTHHVVSMSSLYAPSYLIAKVRMEELRQRLMERFGRAWWRSAGAGAYLRRSLMGPGWGIELSSFSAFDPQAYWRRYGLA